MAARAPAVQGAGPVEGIDWMWVEIVTPVETIGPPHSENYTLRLVDGVASGMADCNRFTGSYTLDGQSLRFGPVASTKMMCPPQSLGSRYAGYFEYIRLYFTMGDTLFMDLMADGGTLRFVKAAAPN